MIKVYTIQRYVKRKRQYDIKIINNVNSYNYLNQFDVKAYMHLFVFPPPCILARLTSHIYINKMNVFIDIFQPYAFEKSVQSKVCCLIVSYRLYFFFIFIIMGRHAVILKC